MFWIRNPIFEAQKHARAIFFGLCEPLMVIFSSFDEIDERLTKLKIWAFFQFFNQRMGLMPQQWKNTNIFVYFTTLKPSFIILLSKISYL